MFNPREIPLFRFVIEIAKEEKVCNWILHGSILSSKANHTTSCSASGITSLETLFVTALAEIIGSSVDDDGSTDYRLGSDEFEKLVAESSFGVSRAICLNVAQVTVVSLTVEAVSVLLSGRIEVWSGRSAAIGVVTKLVNVHSPLCGGIISSQIIADLDRGALRVLGECHCTLDI